MSSAKATTVYLIPTLGLVTVTLLYFHLKRSSHKQSKKTQAGKASSLAMIASRRSSIRPPFPSVVRELLSSCRLAYLSTVDLDNAGAHLSLMRFTYLHDEDAGEIIVMSTNRNTKKFDILQKQDGVALLVHDFQQFGKCDDGVYSITLNGSCRIVDDREISERYRDAHLKHNPDYPQFIVGDDIAILCVHVTSASICNINDQVTRWSVSS
mmetsp:Transcript_1513/g.2269  ORF Transcript_1513/g.2269 Transcript_1513/m.2269 type:complete len:210 (-) Transcript_1513:469-1098(-)